MSKLPKTDLVRQRVDDLLTNGRLRAGRKGPGGWTTAFHDCETSVVRPAAQGIVIAPTGGGRVTLSQTIRAWPGKRYRLDVRIAAAGRGASRRVAGVPVAEGSLSLIARKGTDLLRRAHFPLAPLGPGRPAVQRACLACPSSTGSLEVRIELRVREPVNLRQVRLVECGDLLLVSHPLAVPPEPWLEPPPCLPDRVVLCDNRRDPRPLLGWLQDVFGRGRTARRPAADLPALLRRVSSSKPGDLPAVVLDLPESHCPALPDLLRLSDHTLVVASLRTLAGSAVRAGIRGIRLRERTTNEDMPAATIRLASFHTRGFALQDTIPYGWADGELDFAHRYMQASKAAVGRLRKHGIEVSLISDTGHREHNRHPEVLYRRGPRGALVAMDPDGLEAPAPGESAGSAHDLLWRAALGRDTVTLGQYVVPQSHYPGAMVDLAEAPKQFDMDDVAAERRIGGQGNDGPIWRFPARRAQSLSPRRTLLVRSGFSPQDWPGVYGLLHWLKRLVLASRQEGSAARSLLERISLMAWPIAEPKRWPRCPGEVTAPPTALLPDDLAGVIDLTAGDEPAPAIVVPDAARAAAVRRSLIGLDEDLRAGCPSGQGAGAMAVRVDPASFAASHMPPGGEAGMLLCRILLPTVPQPAPATSPSLTDLAARLLERVVHGLTAPTIINRHWRPLVLDAPGTRSAADDVRLSAPTGPQQESPPGRSRLTIPPGGMALQDTPRSPQVVAAHERPGRKTVGP